VTRTRSPQRVGGDVDICYEYVAKERGERRHGRRSKGALLVVIVLLAGAATGAVLFWPNGKTSNNLSPIERRQLVSWMTAHNPDFLRLGTAVDTWSREAQAADYKSTAPAPPLLRACRALGHAADVMLALRPIPGGEIRRHLRTSLERYRSAAAECSTAAQQGLANHLDLIQRVNTDLKSAGHEMITTTGMINRALKARA
jgi:hypothetical protein